jgi:hypothetical protein
MADQVEVLKLTQEAAIGPGADKVAVSKLVMFAILVPGDSGPDTTNRQGHVYSRQIRRG